jgi:uncharacterized Zn finger protein
MTRSVASKVKFFKCTVCSDYSPFDIREAVAAKVNVTVACQTCGKKWAVSFRQQTCCRIEFMFSSLEASGKRSIKRLQSFSKR